LAETRRPNPTRALQSEQPTREGLDVCPSASLQSEESDSQPARLAVYSC